MLEKSIIFQETKGGRIESLIKGLFGGGDNQEYKKLHQLKNTNSQQWYFLHALFHLALQEEEFECQIEYVKKTGPIYDGATHPLSLDYFQHIFEQQFKDYQGNIIPYNPENASHQLIVKNQTENPHNREKFRNETKWYLQMWKGNANPFPNIIVNDQYSKAYNDAQRICRQLKTGNFEALQNEIDKLALEDNLKKTILDSMSTFFEISLQSIFLFNIKTSLYEGNNVKQSFENAVNSIQDEECKNKMLVLQAKPEFQAKLAEVEKGTIESIMKFFAKLWIYVREYAVGLFTGSSSTEIQQQAQDSLAESQQYWTNAFRGEKINEIQNEIQGKNLTL